MLACLFHSTESSLIYTCVSQRSFHALASGSLGLYLLSTIILPLSLRYTRSPFGARKSHWRVGSMCHLEMAVACIFVLRYFAMVLLHAMFQCSNIILLSQTFIIDSQPISSSPFAAVLGRPKKSDGLGFHNSTVRGAN